MAFKPTNEQQKAIDARGNILVSAAAGSGKTAVLVERVIRLLADEKNPIDANRLLIVTFTNAAANEMRTRIEKRLFEEIKHSGNRRLAKQRLLIYGAKICTIDSFCIDFVKNHFALLHIDPDFKVADPAEERAAMESAFLQTFKEASENASLYFGVMMDCLSSAYGIDEFKTHIFKIWEHSRSLPFPEQWLYSIKKMYANPEHAPWLPTILTHTRDVLKAKQSEIAACLEALQQYPETEKYIPVLQDINTQLHQIYNAAYSDWDAVRAALSAYHVSALPRTKAEQRIKDKIKNCKSEISDSLKELQKLYYCSFSEICEFTRASGAAVCSSIDFILRMSALFEENMRRSAAYPFDMIERMALRLLCRIDDNGTITMQPGAALLCAAFDEILVDEYQDTNDLQDTLFKMLASQNGNLFTVGDVKQSIYGFRHANPNNFLLRKDQLLEYINTKRDGKILLSNNFRSRKDICAFVNFVFGHLMRVETAKMAYNEAEALIYSADFLPDANGGVQYHIIEKTDSFRSREETEAAYIARYIKELVANHTLISLNGVKRKAKYGDFAILMQSPSARAAVYAEALQAYGIPVVVESKIFYETAEVSLALSILKVINNPTDDIALLAVLLSGLFNFTTDKIAMIKMQYSAETLIGKITAAAEAGDADGILFLSMLSKLRIAAATARLGVLVGRMYEETGLLLFMGARENGEKRRENLLKFLNMADSFSSKTHTATLSSFLRSIAKGQGAPVKLSASSETDAVRIMSIHAAKGLQFPYCILACNFSKFNIMDQIGRMVVDEALGIGLKYIDKAKQCIYDTLPRKAISIKLRKEMIAEKIRLLYVAMTRAEYKLDILICENNLSKVLLSQRAGISAAGEISDEAVFSAPGYSAWLLSCALIHPDIYKAFEKFGVIGEASALQTDCAVKVNFAAPSVCVDTGAKPISSQVLPDLLTEMHSNFSYSYPYEALQTVPSKISVSELTKKTEEENFAFTARPSFAQQDGLTSAERGTAMHKFMQFCDFKAAQRSLQDEIQRLYEYEFLSETEIQALNPKTLQHFFSSEICNRIVSAKRLYKEFPFIIPYKLSDTLPENSVVQGVADCVAVTDSGVILIDYKTDKVVDPAELVARYTAQISFYAAAVEKIFGLPIEEQGIYSFYLEEFIRLNA